MTRILSQNKPYSNPITRSCFSQFNSFVSEKLKKAPATPASDQIQQKIAQWIQGNKSFLYLQGVSGNGKSTEVARLLNNHPEFVRHMCAALDGLAVDIINNPLVFSKDSLYPQLEAFYGQDDFRKRLNKGVCPLMAHEPDAAFIDLVVTPIKNARSGTGKQPIIVIDGIDTAVESASNCSILDLLIKYKDELVQGARLHCHG